MIAVPTGARIWVAAGMTDMRKGMQGLGLLVQESLKRDPYAGDLYVFRGRGGSLIKVLWHDGLGLSLYAKRLDRGRFAWPVTVDGVVALTAGQLSYLLEGIDWRNPQHNISGKTAQERLAARQTLSQPILADLEPGCAPSAPSSPDTPPSPKPWTTCSPAGGPSAASWRTAASV